jgi:hypothetical protein
MRERRKKCHPFGERARLLRRQLRTALLQPSLLPFSLLRPRLTLSSPVLLLLLLPGICLVSQTQQLEGLGPAAAAAAALPSKPLAS